MCLLVACRDDDAPVAPLPDAGLDSALVDASSDGALPDAGSRPRRSPDGGRPSSMACGSTIRPAGDAADAGAEAGACTHDDDCDAGLDGRCNVRTTFGGGVSRGGQVVDLPSGVASQCTYHACTKDEDCPGTTSVCGCGVGWAGQNVCLTTSNCRTDDDCAGGQRCVFSEPPILRYGDVVHHGDEVGIPNYSGDAIGWFCTTPDDDCNCPKAGSTDKCIYNLGSKRWDCAYQP